MNKIKCFDLCYRISGDTYLTLDIPKTELPAIDDLSALEIYQIMRMPVIPLPFKKEHPVRTQADLRLEILCCSCTPDCMFIYLFSGKDWQIYYANFN